MIPKACKRLAEVDFPVATVSRHAAREKSIRHGHPSTLHLWWARRPLASSRAVLLALLLPDPCDPHCPEPFKGDARRLLAPVQGAPGAGDEDLRHALLRFIGDFANWDLSANTAYLEAARGLVRSAHGEEPPLVVDPFAGGGSIPLEALRLGCDAFASDLNPVACLILKVLLEDIPRHGPELADEVRKAGQAIKEAAEKDLADLYPPDPDGARPIAYLWARTVRCEAPRCGAEIPLARSFWLCKKQSRKRALRMKVARDDGARARVDFEIFEPSKDADVPPGTVNRAKATCPCCSSVLPPDRVRAQLAAQRGGADVVFGEGGSRVGGARMLAVVTLKEDERGRQYRLPEERDYAAVRRAMARLDEILAEPREDGLCPVPDEPTPAGGGSGAGRAFSVQKYGMMQWGDLFTARQKVCHARLVAGIRAQLSSGAFKHPTEVGQALALVMGRLTDKCAGVVYWHDSREFVDHVFARQALIPQWNTAEAPVFSDVGFEGCLRWVTDYMESAVRTNAGQAILADAATSALPDQSTQAWFTDPPYYDAIPYSDLADFFFVWMKRVLPDSRLLRDPSDPENTLTPKRAELVEDASRAVDGVAKDKTFFERGMNIAFRQGRRLLADDGVGSVVFAHKTTEGWEALLGGLIGGGWTITASWPIATEMATRLRARQSAALATSVHLVCRPRPEDAPVGDWDRVYRELPIRVGDWMERLQREGIRGADLVFACIGPALEIYSRYSKVVDAEEREIPLGGNPEAKLPHERGYLTYVWETVGRTALGQVLGTAEARARNGDVGALEEDARLTALFLWALQATSEGADTEEDGSSGEDPDDQDADDDEGRGAAARKQGFTLVFDVVRRFAQPLGIHLPDWEGRVVEVSKGVVRLLPMRERAKLLFGEGGTDLAAERIETGKARTPQLALFGAAEDPVVTIRGSRGRRQALQPAGEGELRTARAATTLDRLHAAMLLQSAGRSNALRALLSDEVERGPEFIRLANALSALYPGSSDEKRLLDAMLLAVPR